MQYSPQPNLSLPAPRLSLRFWAAVALTGAAAGLAGGLLMRLLYFLQTLAWPPVSGTGDLLNDIRAASALHRVEVLAMAGLIAGLGRAVLALHRAKGHGGDLSQAIWRGDGRMPLLHTLGNALLSIVLVAMGGSLGREGAVKQTGAGLGSKLGEWLHLTVRERRLLLACGAGAGIAAAYNVPLGGAMFAAEVLLGSLAIPQVVPALLASLLGTAASWTVLPNLPAYTVDASHSPFSLLVWAAAAGPMVGLAAAGYISVVGWSDRQHFEGVRMVLVPFVTLVGLGLVATRFPELLGNGKEVAQQAFSNHLDLTLLLAYPILKVIVVAACLRAGVPGGLFTPTLTCGAVLGAALGAAAAWAVPSLKPTDCALIGAGAFLASTMGGPLCAIVLLLELTRHIQGLLVPLMLAVAGASLMTRSLERRTIYTARFHELGATASKKVYSPKKIAGAGLSGTP